LFSLTCWGGEPDWAWINAVPTGDANSTDWFILTGKATVSIHENRIEARLFDQSGKHVTISIKGTISGSTVKATVIYDDSGPSQETGVYRQRKTDPKVQTITFQNGASMLGLAKLY